MPTDTKRCGAALLGALVIAAISAPSLARADAPADARDLFVRGRDLRTHGDCASAVAVFRRAYDVYPAGLGSLRNIAECEESMGHFASARRAWLDLQRALLTNRDDKYRGWVEDAEKGAARLVAKVATLTIDVEAVKAGGETAAGEGLEVTVNGEVLTPGLLGTPLERDPGRYIVRLAGPHASAPQERVVELVAGDAKRVALRALLADSGQPAVPISATVPPTAEAHARTNKRTAAWIAMGVGAAGFIGMGIALAMRQSDLGDLQNVCGSTVSCPNSVSAQSIEDRGHMAATLVNVFGAVGLIGLASGVVLLATGPPQSARTSLVVSPASVSAIARF